MKTKVVNKAKQNDSEEILVGSDISPHNQAVYEAGKTLLIDGVANGQEVCKTMMTTSTTAIPLYLGILSFILPEKYILGVTGGITIAIPAVGFLITATIFIIGYLPVEGKFSLDIIQDIVAERDKIIRHRGKFIKAGMVAFILSTLSAIYAVIINIGVR